MYLTEVVLEVKPTEEKPIELATLELEFKEAPKPIEVTKPKIPWRGPDDFEVVIEKFDETKVVTGLGTAVHFLLHLLLCACTQCTVIGK